MGYKPVVDQATRVTFDDYPGLEIYADSPEMGALMDIADLRMNMNDAADKRMRAFEFFADYIRTWNVDHPNPRVTKTIEQPGEGGWTTTKQCARCGLEEDMPLPTTADAMMCLPIKFIMPVFFGWLSTVSRVDPTRYLNSSNGGSNTQGDLMQRLADAQSPMPFSEPNMS